MTRRVLAVVQIHPTLIPTMLLSSYESGPASPMTDYEDDLTSSIVVCNNKRNINNNSNSHLHSQVNNRRDYDDSRIVGDKDDSRLVGDKDDKDEEFDPARIQLSELQWVCTLGVGGFGRVELVTAGRNNNTAFALKKMKKFEVRCPLVCMACTIYV